MRRSAKRGVGISSSWAAPMEGVEHERYRDDYGLDGRRDLRYRHDRMST